MRRSHGAGGTDTVSIVKVDTDGATNGHIWQQIATIVGVTGMTEVASGNLVVHA
jgi:hypothetical protein